MATYALQGYGRESRLQLPGQPDQRLILRITEREVIGAFKLNPQRKIIAGLTSLEARDTCMPCTIKTGHKLSDFAVTFNQKVRTYP